MKAEWKYAFTRIYIYIYPDELPELGCMELDAQYMMATEKLAEGIRGFKADQIKLENTLAEKL